jgi:hypothetical protein
MTLTGWDPKHGWVEHQPTAFLSVEDPADGEHCVKCGELWPCSGELANRSVSVFWDDHHRDMMSDPKYRKAFIRESRKIKWTDRFVNYLLLPLARFVKRLRSSRTTTRSS